MATRFCVCFVERPTKMLARRTGISDEDLGLLADRLEGTATSIEVVLEDLELDVDTTDVLDDLLNLSDPVELCEGCEWWFRSSQLDDRLCDSCREDEEEDEEE